MQIINNINSNNHGSILLENFKNSDSIIIVSPFISSNFEFFSFDELGGLKKITLLTTLKSKEIDQPAKVKYFRQLFMFGKRKNIEIEILIDNSLHGKLYICQKDNTFFKAIITSANFTSNGLSNNNEWGVWICNMHFSRRRPSGVGIGDILIIYAVGNQKIVSITRVNSGIKNTEITDDRWPYYVSMENLTPFYGKEWNKHNLTIFNQADEALNSGIKNLTPSGKNSFGAFRWGADKLRITEEFANFLINKIVAVDEGLGW